MNKCKISFLAFVLFFFLGCSQKQDVSPLGLAQIPQAPAQILADQPKDKQIQVRIAGNKKYCYAPRFSSSADNGSYVELVSCSSSSAIPARYDVFGRLAYKINGVWNCITAPDTVTQGLREKDYVHLSPCVVNASSQRWKLKDNMFYSVSGFYSLKDDGSYIYAAHFADRSYDAHILDNDMKEWSQTKATPAGLNLEMYLQWELNGTKYYISGRTSSTGFKSLYYNIESGHIALYNPLTPGFDCLYSDVGTKDWAWTWWGKCTDEKAPSRNLAYFRPILVGDGKIAIKDRAGNYLRLTRYGPSWGQLYAARLEYILQDSANSPTSEFLVHKSTQDWLRFVSANKGDNLPFCPAPGSISGTQIALGAQNLGSLSQDLPRPLLMQNFTDPNTLNVMPNLTQTPDRINFLLWEPRLMSIIASTTRQTPAVGICGICMLQAYQIIAEILEDPLHPRANGGYFFNTAPNVDPFISFRARNSLLYDTFADILEYYSLPAYTQEAVFTSAVNVAFASSISILPQYNWTLVGQSQTSMGIDELLTRVFMDPPGTMYLALLSRRAPGESVAGGHTSVILRTNAGASVIPTNVPNIDLADLRIYMQNTQTVSHLREMLGDMGSAIAEISGAALLRVGEVYTNPFNYAISFNNCTGFGNNRHGNAAMPSASSVNQCASGRCAW